ncbi:hypothetical protein KQX54_002201 [Cotesia glomerata]|uniref:Uncharacterized protein n=1 Tax=Cotesia glomerata TaxID=32391 RepID=A0AAV7INY8_COTGL|nr:hypothetical protein KQX54_002201 [Cotesia glomerata]
MSEALVHLLAYKWDNKPEPEQTEADCVYLTSGIEETPAERYQSGGMDGWIDGRRHEGSAGDKHDRMVVTDDKIIHMTRAQISSSPLK